jgi:hypothetical protein
MLTEISYEGIDIIIDTDELRAEFNKLYGRRFIITSLRVVNDPDDPGSDSMISGSVKSAANSNYIFLTGLHFTAVNFNTGELDFCMSPVHFAAIRDALIVEYQQQRFPFKI